jgi:riboflavin biosynthesis pyrimidine reductase
MQRLWPSFENLDPDDLFAAYALDRSRPGLRMNFVSSLDGAVEVDGYSRGLSNATDQQILHTLRVHTDGVMVGAGTLRHEGYGPVRLRAPDHAQRVGLAPDPTLVIVSSSLALDPANPALTDAPVRPIVLTHAAAPAGRRTALAAVADVVTCGETAIDPAAGLAILRERGLDQILCEGGPHLFGALLAADVVDEMCLTISAQLAGSGAGRIIADGPRTIPLSMNLIHILADGNTLFTRYAR